MSWSPISRVVSSFLNLRSLQLSSSEFESTATAFLRVTRFVMRLGASASTTFCNKLQFNFVFVLSSKDTAIYKHCKLNYNFNVIRIVNTWNSSTACRREVNSVEHTKTENHEKLGTARNSTSTARLEEKAADNGSLREHFVVSGAFNTHSNWIVLLRFKINRALGINIILSWLLSETLSRCSHRCFSKYPYLFAALTVRHVCRSALISI